MNWTPKSRQEREQEGRRAEGWASFLLRLKGYRILAQRFQNPCGEIDLVVQKGKTLIFCEVKSRPTHAQGLEALSLRQQQRIIRGAMAFQSRYPHLAHLDTRFDYIIVTGWRWYHLKDAWRG